MWTVNRQPNETNVIDNDSCAKNAVARLLSAPHISRILIHTLVRKNEKPRIVLGSFPGSLQEEIKLNIEDASHTGPIDLCKIFFTCCPKCICVRRKRTKTYKKRQFREHKYSVQLNFASTEKTKPQKSHSVII